jgi:hypothetical protein
MSGCTKNAKPVADVLHNVNSFFGRKVWTDGEITNVSNKIACNFFGTLPKTIPIVLKPLKYNDKTCELSFIESDFPLRCNKEVFTFPLKGHKDVDTISFIRTLLPTNENSSINMTNEDVTIVNGNDSHLKHYLQASAVYPGNYINKQQVNYHVYNATGIFENAKKMKITFDNEDKSRKVEIFN